MLFLIFQLGQDRYAMEPQHIVEVFPMLQTKSLPQAPPGVLGLFNYHGRAVPLLDLMEFSHGRPSRGALSTRIVLVHYPSPDSSAANTEASERPLLGLVAEQATTLLRLPREEFKEAGISVKSTPYLGPIYTDQQGVVQLVEVGKLLPVEVRDLLLASSGEAY